MINSPDKTRLPLKITILLIPGIILFLSNVLDLFFKLPIHSFLYSVVHTGISIVDQYPLIFISITIALLLTIILGLQLLANTKQRYQLPLLCLPFVSLIISVFFFIALLFVIGIYSIVFKGEFM